MRPSKIKTHSYKDITIGSIYSQWKVIDLPILKRSHYRANCKCSCGTVKFVKTHNLLSGKSKSCGCIQRLNLPLTCKGKPSRNAVAPAHLAVTQLINTYKHDAKTRNLSYTLTRNELEELIKGKCFYCNDGPSNIKITKGVPFRYNGIDRFDNNIGYELSNCRSCCYTCNTMKLDMPITEFIEQVAKISKNNKIVETISNKKINAYHARALAIASQSYDVHTKVGAVLINPKTLAVMSEGYNGFIRGAPDGKLPTSRPEKYDYMVHAEMNLVCNAVRSGVKTDDAIVYCTLSPCTQCLRMLWQAGISTFYFKEKYKDFDKCTGMLDMEVTTEQFGDFFKMSTKPRQ